MGMYTHNCTLVAFGTGLTGMLGWLWQNLFVLNFSATASVTCTIVSGSILLYQKIQKTRRQERMEWQSSEIDQSTELLKQANDLIFELGKRNAVIMDLNRRLSGLGNREEAPVEAKKAQADAT